MSETATQLVPEIREIQAEALGKIASADSPDTLEQARIACLGRSAPLTRVSQKLKGLSREDRPAVGKALNLAKRAIESRLAERKAELTDAAPSAAADAIDVTLPGLRTSLSPRHPIMETAARMKEVLLGLGFRYDDYPEVESEFQNFDALNTPDWHPARDMHDTFYTDTGHVMRTHTSAFQTRAMKMFGPPPLSAMTFGRCYRCDTKDATHYPVFHQMDAICIGRDISFANLRWTLESLVHELFGEDSQIRFRPSYFPFTTPSAEVDVLTPTGWMEILGAGMIRPEVLRHGGIDPDQWQGFAFGIGIDRMAMRRYAVDDIRLLYNDEDAFRRKP
ncbi:MAG: phenylalanine--tRNA ligase subunit alpha [Phycisphaeraceae bacterium]